MSISSFTKKSCNKNFEIIHLTTLHPRDDARIYIKEVKTLASSLPHEVVLMVADGKGNEDKEQQGRVYVYDLGLLGGGRFGRFIFGSWRAFFAINKHRPTVVHFHDPELIPLAMLLKIIVCKVIYDIHEDLPRQILSKEWLPAILRKPITEFMRCLEWLAAKVFDAIVPATPKIAERFPVDKTAIIQNFPVVKEMLGFMQVPYIQRPKAFAYAGYITKDRGIFEVVQALHMLHEINGIRLDLAGKFTQRGLEDELKLLSGWPLVRFHGWLSREQLALFLGSVRAGLVLHHPIPNEIDAQPIKLYEYMSAGLPIIASNFPLLMQIIEDVGCGLIVDPLDIKAVAAAMRWLLDHPDDAEAMGRRGRQAVLRIYNWDVEAVKLINLYNKILDSY